jgi:hypothetical protein
VSGVLTFDPHGRSGFLPKMNYEFYFLKKAPASDPKVLRVMARSYENAAAIVAQQCGHATTIEPCESGDIRPIEIQNIFERGLFPTSTA